MDSILSSRQRGRSTQGQTAAGDYGTHLPEGSVTHVSPFPTPIHGEIDGQGVRILALGNVTGFSPGYLCVDQTGVTAWVPLAEVRVNDPNFLPMQITRR